MFSTIWHKCSSVLLFSSLKRKHMFNMKLKHENTDKVWHVPILVGPGMTSSIMSHGWLNDIIQHFLKNLFLVLSYDTKVSHFKWSLKLYRQSKTIAKLSFILLTPPPQDNSTAESISVDISVCTFGTMHISDFTAISGLTIWPASVANFLWGV